HLPRKSRRLFCPTSQACRAEIILFTKIGTRVYSLPSRLDKRGVRPIVTEREAGCDGRCWCAGDVHRSVRSSRVVLIPRRWNQACRDDRQTTGASTPGTPGRARSSRKPSRRECRMFRPTCSEYLLVRRLPVFACEAAGAASARHSLRPLLSEGHRFAKPGRDIAPRGCGFTSSRHCE